MDEANEKFLRAEEIATKYAEMLEQLYNEANSYNTATKELETARKQLLSLVEGTQKAINGSYEIIKTLRVIGVGEILNRIAGVENKVTDQFNEASRTLNSLNKYISEEIRHLEGKIEGESKNLGGKLGKIKTLVLVAFGSLVLVVYLITKFVK